MSIHQHVYYLYIYFLQIRDNFNKATCCRFHVWIHTNAIITIVFPSTKSVFYQQLMWDFSSDSWIQINHRRRDWLYFNQACKSQPPEWKTCCCSQASSYIQKVTEKKTLRVFVTDLSFFLPAPRAYSSQTGQMRRWKDHFEVFSNLYRKTTSECQRTASLPVWRTLIGPGPTNKNAFY